MLILEGNLEFERVPDEILSAFNKVRSDPIPKNLTAVKFPFEIIFPVLYKNKLFDICNALVGKVVPIPTLEVVEIFPPDIYQPSIATADIPVNPAALP